MEEQKSEWQLFGRKLGRFGTRRRAGLFNVFRLLRYVCELTAKVGRRRGWGKRNGVTSGLQTCQILSITEFRPSHLETRRNAHISKLPWRPTLPPLISDKRLTGKGNLCYRGGNKQPVRPRDFFLSSVTTRSVGWSRELRKESKGLGTGNCFTVGG